MLVGTTIKVAGRELTVADQAEGAKQDGTVYILTGKRGARYATMRNANHPERMFLVHAGRRGFGIPAGYERVWLTDVNGALEVLP